MLQIARPRRCLFSRGVLLSVFILGVISASIAQGQQQASKQARARPFGLDIVNKVMYGGADDQGAAFTAKLPAIDLPPKTVPPTIMVSERPQRSARMQSRATLALA